MPAARTEFYCFGTLKYKDFVMPAQAGIQCRSAITDWTPVFAGVTERSAFTQRTFLLTPADSKLAISFMNAIAARSSG